MDKRGGAGRARSFGPMFVVGTIVTIGSKKALFYYTEWRL